MDILSRNILELFLFFISFPFILKLFNATRFEQLFKKGKTTEIQLLYIFTVIIFTYLFTQAIINIIYLSTSIVS
jgi:uncharacterized membrane protein YwzB